MDHKSTNSKTRTKQIIQYQNIPTSLSKKISSTSKITSHIHTDGSKQGIKVGCAAIFQNQELLKDLPNELSTYCAEITAIDLFKSIIANHKSSKFIIYKDSKSVLLALQNKDRSTKNS